MEFNLKNYENGKYAMYCETEEEDEDFRIAMNELGKRWSGGTSYIKESNWSHYKERGCHNFMRGTYGTKKYYEEEGYKILYWKDFISMCRTCKNKNCEKCCFNKRSDNK